MKKDTLFLFKGDYKQLDHKNSTSVEDWYSRPPFNSVIDVQWTPTVQGSHVSEWMTHDSPKRFCSLYTSPWLRCTNRPTSWHSGQRRLQGQSKFKTKQKWTLCLYEAYILGNICGFASPASLPVVPALWYPFGEPFSGSERRWGWLILGCKGRCELKACTIRTLQPPGHKIRSLLELLVKSPAVSADDAEGNQWVRHKSRIVTRQLCHYTGTGCLGMKQSWRKAKAKRWRDWKNP